MRRFVGCAAWLACAAVPALAQSTGALGHYDLAHPVRQLRLPGGLAEISGIAFTGDGRLLAHGDEEAAIWQLDPDTGTRTSVFGLGVGGATLKGDFEDIQVVGDQVFLVTSAGELYQGPEAANGKVAPAARRSRGVAGACEVEGLAWDRPTRSFLLLCKEARSRRWRDQVVILTVSAETGRVEAAPRIVVPVRELARVTGVKRFDGSALVRHPRTGTLILLAGPQQAYAEIDSAGRVLGGGRLDPRRHRQPEGIAIAPNLTLLISDEGAGKHGTITAYAWRP